MRRMTEEGGSEEEEDLTRHTRRLSSGTRLPRLPCSSHGRRCVDLSCGDAQAGGPPSTRPAPAEQGVKYSPARPLGNAGPCAVGASRVQRGCRDPGGFIVKPGGAARCCEKAARLPLPAGQGAARGGGTSPAPVPLCRPAPGPTSVSQADGKARAGTRGDSEGLVPGRFRPASPRRAPIAALSSIVVR